MKHLGISGGGTKISGLYGMAEAVMRDKGYAPEVISGISAGAVLAVPLALKKFDLIKSEVLNLDLKTFFSVPPINKKGKIRTTNAIWRILRGKVGLGSQDNLEKTLSRVVNPSEFAAYKSDSLAPKCIVGSIDFYTGCHYYADMKEASYENFLKLVNASSSIPIYTEGIYLQGPVTDFEGKVFSDPMHLYDGGVRDHSPSGEILESDALTITETISLFSRPEDVKSVLDPKDYTMKGVMQVLDRYVSISNTEVSKNDESYERSIIAEKNILDRGTYYLPKIAEHVYDVRKEILVELYEEGRRSVLEKWQSKDWIA